MSGGREFLNHDVVARKCANTDVGSLPDYIVHLHKTLAGPQRILALKASWISWPCCSVTISWQCSRVSSSCTASGTTTLGQAVSYAIALRNGRWMQLRQDGQGRLPEQMTDAPIPLEEIEERMDVLHRANLLIRLLCEAHGLRRWEIGYQRLCQDKGAHLSAVLHAEGLVAAGWMPGTPRLERQAGALNARLCADMLERVRKATAPR